MIRRFFFGSSPGGKWFLGNQLAFEGAYLAVCGSTKRPQAEFHSGALLPYNDGMDDSLYNLAKAASASMRGASVDAQWLYAESLALIQNREEFQPNALRRTLFKSARALNDLGEYAFGGEIFELLLNHSRDGRHPKIELDALEGLAQSWFYLGDKERAFQYLNTGLESAARLKKSVAIRRFEDSLSYYKVGKGALPPGKIRAPANAVTSKSKRKAHISTLLKKERQR